MITSQRDADQPPIVPPSGPSNAELELLRLHSIQVLGSAVTALEAAARQKQLLHSEVRAAQDTLRRLVDERELAEARLATTRARLDEAATQLTLVGAQRDAARGPAGVAEPAVVQLKGVGRFRPIHQIFSQVATCVLVALLLAMALLLTPLTRAFGDLQLLAVTTGSMNPGIPIGGVVAIRPVTASDLQIGDAITFANLSTPDLLITHRIVSLEVRDGQTMLTTKGDANKSVDGLSVPASRAVGRVEFALPWLGDLMVWLGLPTVKIGIVSLAIMCLGLGLASVHRSNGPSTKMHGPRLAS